MLSLQQSAHFIVFYRRQIWQPASRPDHAIRCGDRHFLLPDAKIIDGIAQYIPVRAFSFHFKRQSIISCFFRRLPGICINTAVFEGSCIYSLQHDIADRIARGIQHDHLTCIGIWHAVIDLICYHDPRKIYRFLCILRPTVPVKFNAVWQSLGKTGTGNANILIPCATIWQGHASATIFRCHYVRQFITGVKHTAVCPFYRPHIKTAQIQACQYITMLKHARHICHSCRIDL